MSVLVKGIKMSQCCNDCFSYDIRKCCLYSYGIPSRHNYDALMKPEWCELVEVKTPHGRLIDADELLNKLQELFDRREKDARFTGNKDNIVTWNDAIYHIKIAPTVIEAEEKKNEIN